MIVGREIRAMPAALKSGPLLEIVWWGLMLICVAVSVTASTLILSASDRHRPELGAAR
jgi:hypothetical protein